MLHLYSTKNRTRFVGSSDLWFNSIVQKYRGNSFIHISTCLSLTRNHTHLHSFKSKDWILHPSNKNCLNWSGETTEIFCTQVMLLVGRDLQKGKLRWSISDLLIRGSLPHSLLVLCFHPFFCWGEGLPPLLDLKRKQGSRERGRPWVRVKSKTATFSFVAYSLLLDSAGPSFVNGTRTHPWSTSCYRDQWNHSHTEYSHKIAATRKDWFPQARSFVAECCWKRKKRSLRNILIHVYF